MLETQALINRITSFPVEIWIGGYGIGCSVEPACWTSYEWNVKDYDE